MVNLNDYMDVFSTKDSHGTMRANVTPGSQLDREIEMLLGPVKTWSSESDEVKSFRQKMKLMQVIDNDTTYDKYGLLPKQNLTIDPAAAKCEIKELICRIYLPKSNSFKTLTCSPSTTADEFLDKFKTKMIAD